MTVTAGDPLLHALELDLPPVERRPSLPAGFASGATTAGIKASGRPDLAILRTTGGPAATAAVFTTNQFPAAPVLVSRTNLAASLRSGGNTSLDLPEGVRPGSPDDPDTGRYGYAEAVISTSGSANAATGMDGMMDQLSISMATAMRLGVDPLKVLCLSTGIIGTRLPVDRVKAGIDAVAGTLATTDEALLAAAEALRTTDSVTKVATTSFAMPHADGQRTVHVRVSGMAKGVGMIHPRMATMLSVITTDATIEPLALSRLIRPIIARTWNQLTVDGDTSTNDTVFVLASGALGGAPIQLATPAADVLRGAIEAVARDLARQQAADGEGASSLLTVQVTGAADDADARAVARAVASSSLVKAAVHGRDPNWGRIAGAAGNARHPECELLELAGIPHDEACRKAGRQVRIDPDKVRIAIAGHLVFDGSAGGPQAYDKAAASRAMDAPEVLIRVDLGMGDGRGEAFGCDLTEEYVRENSEYTT